MQILELRSKGKGKKSIHFNGSDETVEWILRTVISVNQLSIYGPVADLCKELARDSPSARKHAENEKWELMVEPTEFPNVNTISHTDMSVQGNVLREYEQKFAELPEDQKLTTLCSDAGFMKDIGKGQFFITLEEEGPDDMQTLCREYTLPHIGKLVSKTAHADNACSLRKRVDNSTKTDLTHCRFPDM